MRGNWRKLFTDRTFGQYANSRAAVEKSISTPTRLRFVYRFEFAGLKVDLHARFFHVLVQLRKRCAVDVPTLKLDLDNPRPADP